MPGIVFWLVAVHQGEGESGQLQIEATVGRTAPPGVSFLLTHA
jgi:hypothetical protein